MSSTRTAGARSRSAPETARSGGSGSRATPRGSGPGGRITPDDIAAKLRDVGGGAQETVETTKSAITWVAIAAAGTAILGAYFLGRRRGRKRRAVIEIRRV